MSDYSPVLVKEFEVRNFFTPPLSYDDVNTAEVLLKIESVEKYLDVVYGITTATDGRIPALLLIASKIVENPILATKYHKIDSEKLGDYSYTLSKALSAGSSYDNLASTWKNIAMEILEAKIVGSKGSRWRFEVVND